MEIIYTKFECKLFFNEAIQWPTLPTIPLRSVLGAKLKLLCCLKRGTNCSNCVLHDSCAYGYLFESESESKQIHLNEFNQSVSPYILSSGPVSKDKFSYTFEIILVDRAIDFVEDLRTALIELGKEGIFNKRLTFTVKFNPLADLKKSVFEFDKNFEAILKKISIRCIDPLRIKQFGKYTTDFDSYGFFMSLHRRFTAMSKRSTDSTSHLLFANYKPSKETVITERELRWFDLRRFSHHQNAEMSLGGAIGTFSIEGNITGYEYSLLKAASIFHGGKNTSFGLGKIELMEIQYFDR